MNYFEDHLFSFEGIDKGFDHAFVISIPLEVF